VLPVWLLLCSCGGYYHFTVHLIISRYSSFNRFLFPWWALLLIPYLSYTEWRLGEKPDYAWQLGRLVCGRISGIDWRIVSDGVLSMLIRTLCLATSTFANHRKSCGSCARATGEKALELLTPESHALRIMSAIYRPVLIIAIIPGIYFQLSPTEYSYTRH